MPFRLSPGRKDVISVQGRARVIIVYRDCHDDCEYDLLHISSRKEMYDEDMTVLSRSSGILVDCYFCDPSREYCRFSSAIPAALYPVWPSFTALISLSFAILSDWSVFVPPAVLQPLIPPKEMPLTVTLLN